MVAWKFDYDSLCNSIKLIEQRFIENDFLVPDIFFYRISFMSFLFLFFIYFGQSSLWFMYKFLKIELHSWDMNSS